MATARELLLAERARAETLRAKTSATWSGRPMSRLSG